VTSAGTISSPGYPSNYADNLRCGWVISARKLLLLFYSKLVFDILIFLLASGRIKIAFNDFSTESCCDFVELYEGNLNVG